MQTVTINIQDNFFDEFLSIVEKYKDKMHLQKDKNIEYDRYFYQRQNELQQIRDDIKTGKMEMISQEQYDMEMVQFFDNLKKEHASKSY
jgi:hypothetical protein